MSELDIANSAHNIPACPACSLILKWNTDSKTTDISSTFLNLENDSTNFNETCSVCLGILQRPLSERILNDVFEKFRSMKCDANLFNLAITIPPSCYIREKVGRLLQRYEDQEESKFALSLKDACRLCYQIGLERLLSEEKIIHDAQSDFTVSLTFENSKADETCTVLQRCFPDRFPNSGRREKRKRTINGSRIDGNNSDWSRSTIMDVLPSLTRKMVDEMDLADKLRENLAACTSSISFTRSPLFIGGRYCKYSRCLSQTPWVVDGVRRGETSVQELICDHLITAIGAEEAKFTSSGREDTDVRMLGDGRPFAIQFANARRKRTLDQSELDNFQRLINESTKDIRILQLRVVGAHEFATLKEGEEHKKKTYVALIWSPTSLNGEEQKKRILDLASMEPVELEQKTPIRVLHRRPLAVRRRTVEDFRAVIIGDHHFQLQLTTQAGTYVKEFVHGDFGRTKPSLSDLLGIPVDILELDVQRIHLSWP